MASDENVVIPLSLLTPEQIALIDQKKKTENKERIIACMRSNYDPAEWKYWEDESKEFLPILKTDKALAQTVYAELLENINKLKSTNDHGSYGGGYGDGEAAYYSYSRNKSVALGVSHVLVLYPDLATAPVVDYLSQCAQGDAREYWAREMQKFTYDGQKLLKKAIAGVSADAQLAGMVRDVAINQVRLEGKDETARTFWQEMGIDVLPRETALKGDETSSLVQAYVEGTTPMLFKDVVPCVRKLLGCVSKKDLDKAIASINQASGFDQVDRAYDLLKELRDSKHDNAAKLAPLNSATFMKTYWPLLCSMDAITEDVKDRGTAIYDMRKAMGAAVLAPAGVDVGFMKETLLPLLVKKLEKNIMQPTPYGEVFTPEAIAGFAKKSESLFVKQQFFDVLSKIWGSDKVADPEKVVNRMFSLASTEPGLMMPVVPMAIATIQDRRDQLDKIVRGKEPANVAREWVVAALSVLQKAETSCLDQKRVVGDRVVPLVDQKVGDNIIWLTAIDPSERIGKTGRDTFLALYDRKLVSVLAK